MRVLLYSRFLFQSILSVFVQKHPLRDLPWPLFFLRQMKKGRVQDYLSRRHPLSKDAQPTIGLDSTGQTTTRSPPRPRSQANGRNRVRGSLGKEKGEGYASPAIKDNLLMMFHRKNGYETIECIDAKRGTPVWEFSYPVEYRDRYGYSNGPRASPVIAGNHVYAHGVTAWLTCLEVKTGKKTWQRNLAVEFEIPQYFFGKGSTPIVIKDTLIVSVGGSNDRCVVGFDRFTGKTNG